MEVTFVRERGRRDRIYGLRADGSEVSWHFPSYGDRLPHDLVHLVVESALALKGGFWGRVASGIDPSRANADADRQRGPDRYRAFGDDLRELMLAEALAGVGWCESANDAAVLLGAIERNCLQFGIDLPDRATLAHIGEIDRVFGMLTLRWQRISTKGSIKLAFDVAAPERSFQDLVNA